VFEESNPHSPTATVFLNLSISSKYSKYSSKSSGEVVCTVLGWMPKDNLKPGILECNLEISSLLGQNFGKQ
jgi:hypothetical protein